MTLTFDNNAIDFHRNQSKLFNVFENTIDLNKIIVSKCSPKLAREYIATYHYSHILPDCVQECFVAKDGTKIVGVLCYGRGATNDSITNLVKGINLNQTRELVRLWCKDNTPKNTESFFIAKTLKLLPKEVKAIVSFSDEEQNHFGTIYQASNFYYLGKGNSNQMLINSEGKKFHIRTIGSYKRRHPELKDWNNKSIMEKYNWKPIKCQGKHKYILFIGSKGENKRMFNQIKDFVKSYPKAVEVSGEKRLVSNQESQGQFLNTALNERISEQK